MTRERGSRARTGTRHRFPDARLALAPGAVTMVSCSSDDGVPSRVSSGEDGLPVPVQLRMIDPSALRLSGTIAGRSFSLDAPDRNGRWVIGTTVPSGVPLPTPLGWFFAADTLPTIRADITLAERGRLTVAHLSGTPSDTGAGLYDADSTLVAADDDSGPERLFLLESTVLEPGSYCLAHGHYLAIPVPSEGWTGSIRIETTTTAGRN